MTATRHTRYRIATVASLVLVFLLVSITACAEKDTLRTVGNATNIAITGATPTRPWCPTATPLATDSVRFGPPPPPPGTPTRVPPTLTGPRPTALVLPTLDSAQLTPPTVMPAALPTEPPLDLVTPVADWITYGNLDVGFSFDYPANWYIEGPDQSCRPLTPTATSVEVRNYNINTAVEKGLLLPEMLYVNIHVSPNFAQYGTIDQWAMKVRHNGIPQPDISFSPIQHFSLKGLPAVRWTARVANMSEGVAEVLIGKGIWSFYINAYPASSGQLATFDRILSSFQIP